MRVSRPGAGTSSCVLLAPLALCVCLIGAPSVSADRGSDDARTEPIEASLAWKRNSGAEDCIDATALKAAVEQLEGRPIFTTSRAGEVRIDGTIAPNAAGTFHATLVLRDAKGNELGRRVLDGGDPSCHRMDEPLALVIALALRSIRERLREQRPIRVPAAPPRELESLGAIISLSALGISGLFPRIDAGLALASRLDFPARSETGLALELGVRLFAPVRRVEGGAGGEFVGGGFHLGARVIELGSGPLSFALLGGVGIDLLIATGVGSAQTRKEESLVPSTWARADVSLELTRHLSIALYGGAAMPFVRDRFVLRSDAGDDLVFRPSAVFAMAGLGFAVTVP